MSALSIQVPFPVFQDRDGQPLDNGYVWLGTSSLNPQTNPIACYYDAALTIAATQPLRTLNGFISRAGSPAQVYVDAVNFSILVQDSKGTTVFSVPEGTGISPNASGVVYDPAGTGAVATTVQAKLREQVSVKDFGAVGDGVTDDTAAIQAAFNASKNVVIPPGNYMINPIGGTLYSGGVKPQNGSIIRFLGGAKFTAITNSNGAYVIINLRDTSDVTIYDGDVVGDVGSHTGITGEFGFGYYIASATNARLYNCKASKCWGDGFFVGYSIETTGTPCVGGVLSNCVADDNRRQGLSIVSWSKGLVIGGEYKNTGLTSFTQPAFGIDIEPDDGGQDIIDVKLVGVRTSGNKFGGIQFVPGFLSANTYTNPKFNVNVIGFTSYQDKESGIRFAYPDLLTSTVNVANKVYGTITVTDANVVENVGRGVDFARWVPNAPEVIMNDLTVINCNTGGSTVSLDHQSGIVLFIDVANITKQTGTGKITLNNPAVWDTRAVPKMVLAMNCDVGAGQAVTNLQINNPTGGGWSSTANSFLRCQGSNNVCVSYSNPPTRVLTATETIPSSQWAGYIHTSAIDVQLVLPAANSSIGLEYIMENPNARTLQLKPGAGDLITTYGLNTGEDVVLRNAGDHIKVKSIGSNKWKVVSAIGALAPLGYAAPGKNLYAGAAPVTGTWLRGDRVVNSVPAVGAPKAWVCTVAGTPGTWVSEGNL